MHWKRWLKRKVRSVLGTDEILAALSAQGSGDAENKFSQLYARLLDPKLDENSLGFRKDQVPCLVDINGDHYWLPADLLPFIWHTHVNGPATFVPRFLLETPHYLWIQERLRPGDIVFDCGSNIGLFSIMMAERVGIRGQAHAFEPSPSIFQDLVRVVKMNALTNVIANELALAAFDGEAQFFDVQMANVQRESSHLIMPDQISGDQVLPHLVRTITARKLDTYVAAAGVRPRLIKIDVEGSEFQVLEGARQLLQSSRPLLVIEFHPDESGYFDHARLASTLKGLGYDFKVELKTYYCI